MPREENKSKEQQAAESEVESFRKDLGPFVVAAETTRMAMVFTDAKEANHPLIFANDSFLSLAGYDREEVLGQSFDFLMGRPVDPGALAQVEAAFSPTSAVNPDGANSSLNGEPGVIACGQSSRRSRRNCDGGCISPFPNRDNGWRKW
jgi:PAS domain-containing protein